MKSNTVLFKFNFENGWGDTFLSIFDIVNCANYIKNKYPEFKLICYFNDTYNANVLDHVLNLEFFESFFDEFKILKQHELFNNSLGRPTYNDVSYTRIYSGRNDDLFNHIPGIFDVYVTNEHYDYVQSLDIPFIEFTFNDYDDRAKDFDVFNKDIVDNVDKFVASNFPNGFESIYYRTVPPINEEKIIKFKDKLETELSRNTKYFLCSNTSLVKKLFLETDLDVTLYRTIENHNLSHIPNGFIRYGITLEDSLFAVAELLILSKGNMIHYCGDMSWVSLFNWYSTTIKKVKINEMIL